MPTTKPLLTLALLFVICIGSAQSLSGVYVGAQLYTTPFDGLQVHHLAYQFRPDGSFTDDLSRPDWNTHVAGNYSIKQGQVLLQFKSGQEAVRYKLAPNGLLESTAGIRHTLHPVKKVKALPAGTFVKKTAAARGGMGGGLPGIGTASSDYFSVDGKGHFTLEHEGATGVAGGGMAGRFGTNDKTSGTYKLGDGEIILHFRNGAVAKHTFFYSPPEEEDLIVWNGAFYFRQEGEDRPATATEEEGMPTAAAVLGKLRSRYGGSQIDKIVTLKETASVSGNLQAVWYTDIPQQKIRLEVRQGEKLRLVKQLDGQDGWQWVNGALSGLPAKDKKELQLGWHQGILGLHQKWNALLSAAAVTKSGSDYLLTFQVDDTRVVYLVGADFTLKGNAYALSETPSISVYQQFATQNGITYPTRTEAKTGNQTLLATTTSLDINPVLRPETWKKP